MSQSIALSTPRASTVPAVKAPRKPSVFAEMIRLWIESHQQAISMGLRPF